jgi:histidine ammonia-lyase
MRTVIVNGDGLALRDVVDVARGLAGAELGPDVAARMEPSRQVVVDAVARDAVVYGVTTGFGALADVSVGQADLARMQLALLRSHAAGVGPPLAEDAVRALLLLRARTLAAGYSGCRVELPRRLLELLAAGLLPVVPSKGSVGASGDLAQLAAVALPLVGEGRLRSAQDTDPHGRPAAELLAAYDLAPLTLQPKEGLTLINGTEPMQALLALAVADAELLAKVADVACALSVEALLGTDRAFDERVQVIRPHPGQLASAANLRRLLAGSPLLAAHRHSRHAVQDSYSLRCAPQVHGAARDVLRHCRSVLEVELASVVDNPVVVPVDPGGDGPDGPPADGAGGYRAGGYEVMSTGNFHGQPLAFAGDLLGMAGAELGSISERRVYRLLDPATSRGLPPFLAAEPGTNSGFMLAQYTAASLVSENKVLAHPASVDSIPTSGNQEDHVAMGWHAARKAGEMLDNVTTVLAVEVLCAVQGIDLRAGIAGPGPATAAVCAAVRDLVPAMPVDREVTGQLEAVRAILPRLVDVAETVVGPLH